MDAQFTAISRITLRNNPDGKSTKLVQTDLFLECSDALDKTVYLDENQLPTKHGIKPMTQALVQGLIGNIHMAHQKGWWDSAEHLRYVIAELERGFATPAEVSVGTFTE